MNKLILPALLLGIGTLMVGSVFALGFTNNTTGQGNFIQDMLNHFRIFSGEQNASVTDMLAFHNQIMGTNDSLGEMIQMHQAMMGNGNFNCPMMDGD